jgi:translation initiation factor RLI1
MKLLMLGIFINYSLDLFDNPGRNHMYRYPDMTKTMKGGGDNGDGRSFILHVEAGSFTDSEIIVMLGENGTGKTTFIRMMAGLLKSDEAVKAEEEGDMEKALALGVPQLNVSYKPQKISPKFQGTVRQLLHKKIRDAYVHPQFVSDVMRPMSIDPIFDNGVQDLSGGELQRVAIVLCLGTPADIYLVSFLTNLFEIIFITHIPPSRSTNLQLIWIVNNVLQLQRLLRDSLCTLRRLPLWWSTISSWLHI